jgi:hypothetical protein
MFHAGVPGCHNRPGYNQTGADGTCTQACPPWLVDCGRFCASPRAGCDTPPRDLCQLGALNGCTTPDRCVGRSRNCRGQWGVARPKIALPAPL